jgi:uncharacterized protein UPF0158
MKRLKIDLAELGFAFESSSWAISHYLDTETGAVVMVTEDTRHMLDDLNEMYSGESDLLDNFEDIVGRKGLANEVKGDLKMAYEIEQGFGTRYIKVPETDSIEGYADMKAFIETVTDTHLKETLWSAIQGKGAFGRFKAVLLDHPAERDRWHAFKEAQVRMRVLDWLESEDIEAEE